MANNQSNGFGDGFDGFGGDEGSQRLIKGAKLKFTQEFTWTADDVEVAADREFIAVELIKTKQKWIDGHPVETHILAAHEKITDIDALNEAAPPEEKREKFGQVRGPCEWAYVMYLLDPKTMQIFTYPTSTAGGGQAVRDLRESVGMARRMRGDDVYARVRLSTVFMPTKYGGRDRPCFDIIGYESLGAAAALPAEEQKQIEAPKPVEATPPPATPKGRKAGESKPRTSKL